MKIIILMLGLSGTISLYVLFNTRALGLCGNYCADWIGQYQNVFLFFPVLLVFSVVTYFMKSEVFLSWWKFARIAIPAVLVISTIINMGFHHNNYGPMNLDDMYDIPALLLMYTFFVIGSVVQIWKGYQSK